VYVPQLAASVFDHILWWIGNATEAFILARSINQSFYGKYPAFYFYLTTVLFVELLRFTTYTFEPRFFQAFYWYTEYVAAVAGYAVILEIYKHALKSSPGVARISRTFLLIVFGAVLLKIIASALRGHAAWSPAATSAELERNLRVVQALLLFGIIALVACYKIPTGRNLKGITFGYGFYVCASALSLAFGSLPGYTFRPGWRYVQPIAYLAALFIWGCTLLSYQPGPESETESRIERDYRFLADETKRVLSTARAALGLWVRQGFAPRARRAELLMPRQHQSGVGGFAPHRDLGERIFSPQDWDFVSRETPLEIQRMFQRERKVLAISWLRHTRMRVSQVMRAHVVVARQSEGLQLGAEVRLALNFVLFLILCDFLIGLIWLRGPVRTRRIVQQTFQWSTRLRGAFERLMAIVDPVNRGALERSFNRGTAQN
jgi:hypothetical protein